MLAAITEMRIVLSVIAGLQAIEVDQPVGLDVEKRDLEPVLLQVLAAVEHGLMLGGDGDDVIALQPQRAATPLIARLFDSVAPLVKTISFALAPMQPATCRRAASTASSAFQP